MMRPLDMVLKKISAFAGHEGHYNNGQKSQAGQQEIVLVWVCL